MSTDICWKIRNNDGKYWSKNGNWGPVGRIYSQKGHATNVINSNKLKDVEIIPYRITEIKSKSEDNVIVSMFKCNPAFDSEIIDPNNPNLNR